MHQKPLGSLPLAAIWSLLLGERGREGQEGKEAKEERKGKRGRKGGERPPIRLSGYVTGASAPVIIAYMISSIYIK